jgi:hypothetical protein
VHETLSKLWADEKHQESGQEHSDALLGIFDAIAPAASSASAGPSWSARPT